MHRGEEKKRKYLNFSELNFKCHFELRKRIKNSNSPFEM